MHLGFDLSNGANTILFSEKEKTSGGADLERVPVICGRGTHRPQRGGFRQQQAQFHSQICKVGRAQRGLAGCK